MITSDDLALEALRAETAFVSLDAVGFMASLESLTPQAACLEAPISPETAARVHAIRALSAFLERDEGLSVKSFQAALAADPDLLLSERFGPGHPIHTERRVAEALPVDAAIPLQARDGERLLVDGHLEDAYIPTQPILIQRLRGDEVLDSALLGPAAELPAWAPLAPEQLSPTFKRRLWLGGATVVASSAALLSWGIAFQGYQNFTDPNTNYAQLRQYEQQANRFSTIAIISGGGAAAAGTALILVW